MKWTEDTAGEMAKLVQEKRQLENINDVGWLDWEDILILRANAFKTERYSILLNEC